MEQNLKFDFYWSLQTRFLKIFNVHFDQKSQSSISFKNAVKSSTLDRAFEAILLCTKFKSKDFFSKCDQIRRKLRIWSHLLKKSLMENFIFLCSVWSHTGQLKFDRETGQLCWVLEKLGRRICVFPKSKQIFTVLRQITFLDWLKVFSDCLIDLYQIFF